MIRKPIVAGQFYEENADKLKEEIKRFLDYVKKEKNAIGIITPHAGYSFSGRCAAYAYNSIDDTELYIILGFSHSGFPASISLDDFETPLGIVKNDNEFGKRLIENGLKEDKKSHNNEHSIEVQEEFQNHLMIYS